MKIHTNMHVNVAFQKTSPRKNCFYSNFNKLTRYLNLANSLMFDFHFLDLCVFLTLKHLETSQFLAVRTFLTHQEHECWITRFFLAESSCDSQLQNTDSSERNLGDFMGTLSPQHGWKFLETWEVCCTQNEKQARLLRLLRSFSLIQDDKLYQSA